MLLSQLTICCDHKKNLNIYVQHTILQKTKTAHKTFYRKQKAENKIMSGEFKYFRMFSNKR